MTTAAFRRQLDALSGSEVISLDDAADRLESTDPRPAVVLTFDDGFADVYDNAWPLLRERRVPFTVYLATAYVGGTMHWDGSTARAAGPALTWEHLEEMVGSGLCTVGNHTHRHVRPQALTTAELDRCSDVITQRLGVRPRHFTYPWGERVARMEPSLRRRFRTASTGQLGRNAPGVDPMRLHRIPVRRTDPLEFFRAKLVGGLGAERTYAGIVATAKGMGLRG